VHLTYPTDSNQEVIKWYPELRSEIPKVAAVSSSRMVMMGELIPTNSVDQAKVLFVNLTPFGRITWLLRNEVWKLLLLIFCGSAALYAIFMSIIVLLPYIARLASLRALAAEPQAQLSASSADPIQWGLFGLLGVITCSGIWLWITSREEKKSTQGFDLVKTVGAALAGFLVGKKA
jgi:hypothetical protein